MRLRNAGIDDLFNELLFVLDQAGHSRWIRIARKAVSWAYRALHRALLFLLRILNRRRNPRLFPEVSR
jgi:hypothetical protein